MAALNRLNPQQTSNLLGQVITKILNPLYCKNIFPDQYHFFVRTRTEWTQAFYTLYYQAKRPCTFSDTLELKLFFGLLQTHFVTFSQSQQTTLKLTVKPLLNLMACCSELLHFFWCVCVCVRCTIYICIQFQTCLL